MIGPAVGGWLFQFGGGARLPLLVNAAIVAALIPLVIYPTSPTPKTHCTPDSARTKTSTPYTWSP